MSTPPKKSGPSKKAVSKKTAVVKSKVKKAPKKQASSPLSKTKKTTVKPKVSTTVKAPGKVGIFSWEQWSETFVNAFTCWQKVILGYALILGIVLGLQALGLFALSAVLLSVFGGVVGLEGIMANLQIGTMPESQVVAVSTLLFIAWLMYVIYVGTLSKIAFYALIRNYSQGKQASVLSLFFQEGNRLALSFIGLGFKVILYVMWPVLALLLLFIVWDFLLYQAELRALDFSVVTMLTPWVVMSLIFAALAYIVFAVIRVLFVMPLLVHTGKKAGEALALVKKITKGAWWFTALMWGLFVILLYAANIILTELTYLDPIVLFEGAKASESFRLTDLLAFLISLFIFGPITTAFQYYLMLRSAKNQSVKI